jgi:phosphoribosylformimino-5-aminoimidazole carboxamide ribotide isomerase
MEDIGVSTLICTDISRDGVLGGANLALYERLSKELTLNIVASGGVASQSDIRALHGIGIYGAILGKALYTGDIDLSEAIGMLNSIPPPKGWRETPESWARYKR